METSSGRRELIYSLIGITLYGVLAWLTNVFPFHIGGAIHVGSSITVQPSMRPGVAVPIFFGFVFGPVVGFLTGGFGNLLGDFLSGYLVYPPTPATGSVLFDVTQGLVLNWQLGNALMGFIPGFAWRLRFKTFYDYRRAFMFATTGIFIGIAFAALTDMPLDNRTLDYALRINFLPAFVVNWLNATLLVPLMLYNYAYFDFRSTTWLRPKLVRQLLVVIVVSAVLPVVLLSLFPAIDAQGEALEPHELAFRTAMIIVIILAFTIANALLLAQHISSRVLQLTEAAELMSADKLTREQAAELEMTAGDDETTRLTQLFGHMAREVIQREELLTQQVAQLRIEIDEAKKAQEVTQITETDYFRDLQTKAQRLREKKKIEG